MWGLLLFHLGDQITPSLRIKNILPTVVKLTDSQSVEYFLFNASNLVMIAKSFQQVTELKGESKGSSKDCLETRGKFQTPLPTTNMQTLFI